MNPVSEIEPGKNTPTLRASSPAAGEASGLSEPQALSSTDAPTRVAARRLWGGNEREHGSEPFVVCVHQLAVYH